MIGTDQFVEYAGIVLALLLLEAVLSFDNAAILAAMVRRLPVEDRKKALLYGLIGAYALRITAILVAVWLTKNPWLMLVGGGYLIFLGLKHFLGLLTQTSHEEGHAPPPQSNWLLRLGIPALAATIIQIELVDLAFALDQVLAAVAFVHDIPSPDKTVLIIIASVIGILFLRLAAVMVVRIMDWLPLLEHMAYIAVTFVGVKLILVHPRIDVHIHKGLSIGVTLGLFLVPVLVKLLFGVPRSVTHGELENE